MPMRGAGSRRAALKSKAARDPDWAAQVIMSDQGKLGATAKKLAAAEEEIAKFEAWKASICWFEPEPGIEMPGQIKLSD
jgi:hypothetical protein